MIFGVMISIVPFAFLAFFLLMAAVCGGRVCRTRTVPAALLGGGLLSIGVGGALLLLGTAVFLMRVPASMEHAFVEEWNSPPAAPQPPFAKQVSAESPFYAGQPPAEAPEAPDTESADKNTDSILSQPVQSPGPDRPKWMDSPMGRISGVYRTRVTAGPWHSRTECERQLPEELQLAVKRYADRLLGEGKGHYVNLPMPYVHDHIVCGEWEERREQTIGEMFYLHELLEFDSDANKQIEANYRQSVVQDRLGYTAAGGGVLLGLLTVVFGYLKLDTLTRGYYTGRLRLTATAAILGLAAIAAFLVLG